MIRVTIIPRRGAKTFSLLTKKELSLRKDKKGTLHQKGPKKAGEARWVHKTYFGWIRLQRAVGGVTVALINSMKEGGENQLLSSFIGFIDRHFSDQISSVSIHYESDEE